MVRMMESSYLSKKEQVVPKMMDKSFLNIPLITELWIEVHWTGLV